MRRNQQGRARPSPRWPLLGAAVVGVACTAWLLRAVAGEPASDVGGEATVAASPSRADAPSAVGFLEQGRPSDQPDVVRPAPVAVAQRPAPDDGEDDATDRSPRAGTERAFLEGFERRARLGPDALVAAAGEVFARPGPDAERVALLRALWEHAPEQAPDWFAHALRAGTEHGGEATGHQTVAAFALGWLAERVGDGSAAEAVLGAYVRDASALVDDGLRRRAAAAVAEHGSRAELVRLAADLAPLDDVKLLRAVLGALPRNEHAEAVRPLYAALAARVPAQAVADAGPVPAEEDG